MKGKFGLIAALASVMILAGVGIAADKNIVDTASANANLTTLVDAIKTAGLVDTLKNPGPFTVFAPNNEAFFKMPKEDYKALLENTTELKNVLTFHVVKDKLMSKDLKDGMNLTTVLGKKLAVKVGPDGVMVDGAKVIQADINASNGVIHVIGTVMMP